MFGLHRICDGLSRPPVRQVQCKPTAPNQAWTIDFVSDQLSDGRKIRSLTVVDVYTRESLVIEVGQSLKGEDVVRTLNRLQQQRSAPKVLFCDNALVCCPRYT